MRPEFRSPWTVWAIIMFTCGFGAIYFLYTWTDELKRALGREDVNPAMDILFSLLCFPYAYYLVVRNGGLIRDLQTRAGVPNPEDKGIMMLLASCLCGYGYVMIQEEMNKAWQQMPYG